MKPSSRLRSRLVNTAFLLLGFGALAAVVYAAGPAAVAAALADNWPAIAAAGGLLLVALFLGAVAWAQLVRRELRPRLRDLFPVAAVGYAFNRLLPTGNVGELVKVSRGRRLVPMNDLSVSLVLHTLFGSVVGQVFAFGGALVALLALSMPGWIGGAMLAVSVVLIGATVGTGLLLRLGLLSRLVAWLQRRPRLAGLSRRLAGARRFDDNIRRVASLDRAGTVWALVIMVLVRLTHVAATLWVIHLLLPDMPIDHATLVAFVVNTAGQLIQWAVLILPSGMGAVEGGSALIFVGLGLPAELGVTVALILRIAGLGLASLCFLGFLAPLPPAPTETEESQPSNAARTRSASVASPKGLGR